MKKITYSFLCLGLLLLSPFIWADEVHLKNGNVMRGSVLEENLSVRYS